MIGDQPAIEHAEPLLLERAPLDAVAVQHRRMRGKAGPDGRSGMVFRPVDDSCSRSPNTARPSGFWRAARCRSRSGRRAASAKARQCRDSVRRARCARPRRAALPGCANNFSSTTAFGVAARIRSVNCRSVASSAASGMLLTRPMVMQFAALSSAADPRTAGVQKKRHRLVLCDGSIRPRSKPSGATATPPAPDRGRR